MTATSETGRDITARAAARADASAAAPVAFRGVGRTFGSGADARVVLPDIDLEVAAGETRPWPPTPSSISRHCWPPGLPSPRDNSPTLPFVQRTPVELAAVLDPRRAPPPSP